MYRRALYAAANFKMSYLQSRFKAFLQKLLIENEADLNLQSKNGQTALMATAKVSEDIFNLLISKGADINKKAKDGKSALDLSREKNNAEMTKILKGAKR